MAAVTPATTLEESMGSNTLYMLTFSSVDTSTYTNLALGPQVIGYWANSTSAGGAASVALVSSTGVFTMTNNVTGPLQLFIVAKQV